MSKNRFHIDVRSDGKKITDPEWAQMLFLLNKFCDEIFQKASAYLMEYKPEKYEFKTFGVRKDKTVGVKKASRRA